MSGERAPALLVIGYGNPLREDDGVGWVAANLLRAELPAGRVHCIAYHQLMPELAEPVSQAGMVLFVDARVGGAPGALELRPVAPEAGLPAGMTHAFGPGALLALAELLYGRCPPAQLATVAGASFGYGEGLSPAVRAALPELAARARALLIATL